MLRMTRLPKPHDPVTDTGARFCSYLDYYRHVVAEKVGTLPVEEQRTSRLPTGWSPIELMKHLVFMERRWLHWGFLGEQLSAPWGDEDGDGRWAVGAEETVDSLAMALHAGGILTREIVANSSLSDVAATGGRFESDPPTLEGILFHVLQEYARHAGHLDIARELADGHTGE